MSLGSPALAAYSLVLTSLNARSVYRRVKLLRTNENKLAVARVLTSLQQFPLEFTQNDRLLDFIRINNNWRKEITSHLSRRNAWSIAAGASVVWVILAFLFTLIDSFLSLDVTCQKPSEGQAVGTLWLWLLCLVVGWLWVPTFTSDELGKAIYRANLQTVKKAAKRFKQKMDNMTRRAPAGLSKSALKRHRKPSIDDWEDIKYAEDGTDTNTLPLPEFTYHQSAVSLQSRPDGEQDHNRAVGTSQVANRSAATLPRSIVQNSIYHDEGGLFTFKVLVTLNRDEHRTSATFNYSRIMTYLLLVDDVLKALDRLTRKREVGLSGNHPILEVISLVLDRKDHHYITLPLTHPRLTLCSP